MPALPRDREERFCREYILDLSGKNAAIRAGYAPKSARVQASVLKTRQHIRDRIDELNAERNRNSAVSRERIMRELSRIAFSDMRHHASWSAAGIVIADSADMPEEYTAAVAEVSEFTQGPQTTVRVKLHDKLPALKLLAQMRGMLERGTGSEDIDKLIGGDEDPEIADRGEE